jgi:hypothetical protein
VFQLSASSSEAGDFEKSRRVSFVIVQDLPATVSVRAATHNPARPGVVSAVGNHCAELE